MLFLSEIVFMVLLHPAVDLFIQSEFCVQRMTKNVLINKHHMKELFAGCCGDVVVPFIG